MLTCCRVSTGFSDAIEKERKKIEADLKAEFEPKVVALPKLPQDLDDVVRLGMEFACLNSRRSPVTGAWATMSNMSSSKTIP